MHYQEKDAIAAICLMAAVADGSKSDTEQAKLQEIFEGLGIASSVAVLQRVLLRQTTVAAEAAAIASSEMKMLAFEMAVCVCNADGVVTENERQFLDELKRALSVSGQTAQSVVEHADELARFAQEEAPAAAAPTMPVAASGRMVCAPPLEALPAVAPAADKPMPLEADVDKTILKYAILNGGLELLPESISTLAILPLQMKLVYDIGVQYGYSLDKGHIKEFLAVLGVGGASQMVEGMARKLFGSFAKRIGGHMAGDMTEAAAGAALTFATTYGLGVAAKKYYASGRQLSMADVKGLFSKSTEEAKTLYGRYAGDVAQSARTTNVSNLLSMVRGR